MTAGVVVVGVAVGVGPVGAGGGRRRVQHGVPWKPVLAWLRGVSHWLVGHEVQLGVIAVILAGVAVAAAVARQRRGTRISRARFRGLIVPTETFNPSSEEVLRFAGMLAGTRTPAPLLTPERFRGVRVRLVSRGSDLAYVLETPPWMAPTVRSALMAETELLSPDDLDVEGVAPVAAKPAGVTAGRAAGDGDGAGGGGGLDDPDPRTPVAKGAAAVPLGLDGRDVYELEADGGYADQVMTP